jgi:hypothetical protein
MGSRFSAVDALRPEDQALQLKAALEGWPAALLSVLPTLCMMLPEYMQNSYVCHDGRFSSWKLGEVQRSVLATV